MLNVEVQAAIEKGAVKKVAELDLTHEWVLRRPVRLWCQCLQALVTLL